MDTNQKVPLLKFITNGLQQIVPVQLSNVYSGLQFWKLP